MNLAAQHLGMVGCQVARFFASSKIPDEEVLPSPINFESLEESLFAVWKRLLILRFAASTFATAVFPSIGLPATIDFGAKAG